MTQVDTRAPASFWLGGFGQGANIGGDLARYQFEDGLRRATIAQQSEEAQARVLAQLKIAGDKLAADEAERQAKVAEWQASVPLRRQYYHDLLTPQGDQPDVAEGYGLDGRSGARRTPAGADDDLHAMIEAASSPEDFKTLDHWVKNPNRRGVIDQQFEVAQKIEDGLAADSPTRGLLALVRKSRDSAFRGRLLQKAAEQAAQERVMQAGSRAFNRLRDNTSVDREHDFALARAANLVNQEQANISGRSSARTSAELDREEKNLDAMAESGLYDESEIARRRTEIATERGRMSGMTPKAGGATPAVARKAKTRQDALIEAVRELGDMAPDAQIEAWLNRNYPSFANSP